MDHLRKKIQSGLVFREHSDAQRGINGEERRSDDEAKLIKNEEAEKAPLASGAAKAGDGDISPEEAAIIEMVELRAKFQEWSEAREETILRLRGIADYVDDVSRRTGVAKVIGSGGGAVGGAITVVGGALTVFATAGATAVPLLLAGASIGLASGVTGGAAAIAEKVIKSKQMAEAQEAIRRDRVN